MRDNKNFEITIDNTTGAVKRHGDYARAPLRNLLQSQADIKRQGNAMLAAAADANRAMSGSEAAVFDACTRELAALDQALVHAHAEQDLERNSPTADRPGGVSTSTGMILRPTGRRYAELFGASTLDRAGWTDLAEFASVLHQGRTDSRLAFTSSAPQSLHAIATGGVSSTGGFSVPTEFVARWLDSSLENEIVRPRADVSPMLSDTRTVPGFDATDSSSTLFGGFAGGWVTEGAEITPETALLRMITLHARKLAILSEVSNELSQDGLGYDAQLSTAIIKALGWFMDDAFLNGNGASRPLGALNATCTIAVAKETNQVAGTINYTNLCKMFARMYPGGVKNSVWVANSTTIPQLAQLSIPVGTGGSAIPVMSQTDGSFTILTRPVIFTEKVPTLGARADISLLDLSQYAIGLRQDMQLDKSSHVGFTRDTSHYRGIVRCDGQPKWSKAYTPKNGASLSPFVVLDVRS